MKTALLALLGAAALVAHQSRPPSARLSGVVIEDGSNPARPIRRAIVSITGTDLATPLQVVTDDNGRFVITNLPAGRFNLTADRPSYIKSYYGSARVGRPPGMPIALADGQSIADLTIPLMRGAAITGTVRETNGTPLAGAQIQVSLATIVNGSRKLVSPLGGTKLTTTDDRGVYRAWGLPPGEYVIRTVGGGAAGASSARMVSAGDIAAAMRALSGGAAPGSPALAPAQPPPQTARRPTYFPGVSDPAQAQGIVVAAGDERAGIDIVSQIGRVARVTGTTVGPDGGPVTNMIVGVANVSTGSLYSSPGAVRPNANGEFTVTSLTPGRWLLFGRGAPTGVASDGEFPWWAETEFVVGDQDLSGIVLQFSAGSRVTGSITFQGAAPRPDVSKLRVSMSYVAIIPDVNAYVPSVTPAADGSFVFPAVPPGRYRAIVSTAGSWTLRSATAEGRDTLDTPLVVSVGREAELTLTMTDRPTEVSGVLMDQLGRPAPEYSVIVFTTDRALWTTSPRRNSGVVRLASDGRYRITGMPPGDYLLCVITDVDPGSLSDPAFLEQLARAGVPITLGEGERKTQDFKIGGR